MLGTWISYFCHHRRPIYREITTITTKIARVARNVVSGIDPFQGRIYMKGDVQHMTGPMKFPGQKPPCSFSRAQNPLISRLYIAIYLVTTTIELDIVSLWDQDETLVSAS